MELHYAVTACSFVCGGDCKRSIENDFSTTHARSAGTVATTSDFANNGCWSHSMGSNVSLWVMHCMDGQRLSLILAMSFKPKRISPVILRFSSQVKRGTNLLMIVV